MQKTHRLVVDAMAEIRSMLEPWIDEVFYDFGKIDPVTGSVYVIGRQHLLNDLARIRDLCATGKYTIIFNNSAEGSWTMESQLRQLKLDDLVRQGQLLVVSGSEITSNHICLTHEHLLTTIMAYKETLEAQQSTHMIFETTTKPYQFLFLNGRVRAHRKYLYEKFKRYGLLDRALWTMLDAKPCVVRHFAFQENGIDVMATASPLTRLPDDYEVPRYRQPVFGPIILDRSFLKQELFKLEWGEIYLFAKPYVDTYFSLVTETICAESDVSFRTEKIAKPLAMAHPFIVAANRGYYRDLRNLGFQTFDHLLDESFDLIDNAQDRMDRLITVVADLCTQDLDHFIMQCQDRCKYNQRHLTEFSQQHRQAFPNKFFQFIQKHARS